ncbi:MAG: AcrB/AcrD/AcrF family protein [Sphingomonas sp.]|nr:AcrB/AcrD/AcrF family protein [Sphingomonas sp.]
MSTPSDGEASLARELDRYWLRLTLVVWVVLVGWFLFDRWAGVRWLSLSDTDDNMRLMQVRALIAGQDWYDLRQYRMNPPVGFDMHWTRIVDLPIAGLILALRPFVGTFWAERLACGIAPLLPMSVAMAALSFSVRRLVSPVAWPLALVLLLLCTATMLMFMPERIDHHGWQLAALAVTVAGLADPRMRRGGAIVGLASAFSLSIGLELLPYAAGAGAILALRWVWDRAEAPRLAIYGITLAGGSALGFALFASYANGVARCDALTPVWLSVMVEAGTLLFLLAKFGPSSRAMRLALAAAAGVAIIIVFALVFPQCLGRPEQVSPELARSWLDNVREAKPIYQHPFRNAFPVAALPVMGIIGALVATWRARRTDRFTAWAAVLLFTLFSGGMLFWQARAGPAAQMLGIPGATALAWIVLPWCLGHRSALVRVLGTAAAFTLISGSFAALLIKFLPIDRPDKSTRVVLRASSVCPAFTSLAPLDRLPPQTIFTFVDLAPRLIATTHHSAIAGPYHRNGDAILDVQHAFSGSDDQFRTIARRHGATLLLTCPNMAESTVYRVRHKGGFYDRLARGQAPAWLRPIAMPPRSPLRLWRIG